LRDRRKQTLFIDARKLGTLIDRVHRELTDADLQKIVSTYHAWRSSPENFKLKTENSGAEYTDVPGFCFSATTEANRVPRLRPHAQAATSVPRKSRTTANPLRKRCLASSPS
jgi:hypothetical protein